MPTHDTTPGDAHQHQPSWQATILIISDDPLTVDPIRTRLLAAGHDVRVAAGEDEGLETLFDARPALIIADEDVEGFDAYGFSQKIKGFDESRFTPIILLAAQDDATERTHAYQAGIDDVARKPADLDALAARVQSLLKSRLLYRSLLDENRELQAAHDSHRDFEVLYRAMFAASPSAAFAVDPEKQTIQFASNKASYLTGHAGGTLEGLSLDALSDKESGSGFLQRLCTQVVREGYAPVEDGFIVAADGQRIPVEAGVGRASVGDRLVVILILTDLRHRNAAEVERMAEERGSMLRETAIAVNSRINDPLFVILNDVAALQAALKTAEGPIQSRLARVQEAAQRIQRVTAQLSAISTVVTKDYLPGVRMLDLDESVGASIERGTEPTG